MEVMTVMEGLYVVCRLHVVAAVGLPAEVFVFKGVGMGGVVSLPTRVELVELMGCVRWGTEERREEGL